MVTAQNPEHKLAINTDWVSASAMLFLFVISAFGGAHVIWRLFRGKVQSSPIFWPAIVAALFFVYIGITARVKELKILSLLLSVGPISRALLRLFKAPTDLQNMNSVFIGCVDVLIYFAAAVYVVIWFKRNTTWLGKEPTGSAAQGPGT